MSSVFQDLAKELVDEFNHELSRQETGPTVRAESAELLDLLVSALADRVVLELRQRQGGNGPVAPEALLKLGRRIRDEKRSLPDAETDKHANEVEAGASRFNGRENSPKYANIETLLRYDDARDTGPGVKLVIMNFND